jgi:hypothetical protein
MQDEGIKTRLTRLADYVSGQDVAQYLSLEKLKNVVVIVVAVAAPIALFVIEYQRLSLQTQEVELLRQLVEHAVQ